MKLIPNFKTRSYQSEMIDLPNVSPEERIRNIKELDLFSKISGGNYFSWKEISKIIRNNNVHYNLVDIGCGGGETLKYFAKSAKNTGLKMSFTGVDNSEAVINYMKNNCAKYQEITGVNTEFDNFLTNSSQKIDVLHCSLFCHHLQDTEILCLMKKAKERGSILIISDLSRSKFLYYGSLLLTHVLNGTTLSKHDGPVSVSKGFKKSEIIEIAIKAGYSNYKYKTIPFYRFILVLIS